MKAKLLKCTLLAQGATLLLTLVTNGLLNNIFFAIFWASTIISLVSILNLRSWDIEEWFCFGAITFSMVGGVLYAIRALQHEITIVVLIVILLFMAGATQQRKICAINGRSCECCCGKRKEEPTPRVIIVDNIVEVPKKKASVKKKAVKKKIVSKKKASKVVAAKKKVAKKKAVKKKTTKKKVAKKKVAKKAVKKTTKKTSTKAKSLSNEKFKPTLPTKKKAAKKKTSTSRKK